MTTIQHWINGSPTAGTGPQTAPVFNPATGKEQARVVLGGGADVDAAVTAAANAFETWSESSLTQRTQVMFALRQLLVEHEEELGRIISAEHGKTVDDARGEITRGREVVEYACGLGDVLKTTVYVASSDRADLVAAWNVVRAAFGDHDPPSTLLGVAVLGYPEQLVEVEAVAVRPA